MIIWGSKAKDTQVGSGQFFCPACLTETSYAHRRVSRYFTLYFIPLFPTRTLGEYIKCGSCSKDLRPEVASMSRQQIEAAIEPWVCPTCGNRNPASQNACVGCSGLRFPNSAPVPRQIAAPRKATPPPLPPAQPRRSDPDDD